MLANVQWYLFVQCTLCIIDENNTYVEWCFYHNVAYNHGLHHLFNFTCELLFAMFMCRWCNNTLTYITIYGQTNCS